MGVVTVLLTGLPDNVKLQELASNLDRRFNTDEIGSFRVRDLPHVRANKRQVALDFKSGYDAMRGQELLDSFKYKVDNDKEYVLKAKITKNPEFVPSRTPSPIRSNPIIMQRTGGMDEQALVPYSVGDRIKDVASIQSQIEWLKQQELLAKQKRRTLKAHKKFKIECEKPAVSSDSESVYSVSSDSDCSAPIKSRKRTKKSKKTRAMSSRSLSPYTKPARSAKSRKRNEFRSSSGSESPQRRRSHSSKKRSLKTPSPTKEKVRQSRKPTPERSDRRRSPRFRRYVERRSSPLDRYRSPERKSVERIPKLKKRSSLDETYSRSVSNRSGTPSSYRRRHIDDAVLDRYDSARSSRSNRHKETDYERRYSDDHDLPSASKDYRERYPPKPSRVHEPKEENDDEYVNEQIMTIIERRKDEAIQKIRKEMVAALNIIIYENQYQVTEEDRLTIKNSIVHTMKSRFATLKVNHHMDANDMVKYYRRMFVISDDKNMLQKLINEILQLNDQVPKPSKKNEGASKASKLILKKPKNKTTGGDDNNQDLEALDEVLRDVSMDSIKSEELENEDSVDDTTRVFIRINPITKKHTVTGVKKEIKSEPEEGEEGEISSDDVDASDIKKEAELEAEEGEIVSDSDHETSQNCPRYPIWVRVNDKKKKKIRNILDPSLPKKIHSKPTFFITIKKLLKEMKPYTFGIDIKIRLTFFYVIRLALKHRLLKILQGKGYMNAKEVYQLYREYFPTSNDKEFVECLIKNTEQGIYDDVELHESDELFMNIGLPENCIEKKCDVEEVETETIVKNSENKHVLDETTEAKQESVESVVQQEPVEYVIQQVPVESVVKQERVESVVQQEPVGSVVKQEPVESVVRQEPVESVVKQEPIESVVQQEPVESVVQQKVVELVVKQEPIESVVQQEPLESVIQQEPIESVVQQEPVESVVQQKAVKLVVKQEPIESVVQQEPMESVVQQEPIESVVQQEPVESVVQQKAVKLVVKQEPVESLELIENFIALTNDVIVID